MARPSPGPRSISKRLRFEVFKRDSFRCVYCGEGTPGVLLVVDHVDPVARGGTRDMMNLATACEPCNAGKSDRTLSDSSVVAKRRAQADRMAEQREQTLAAMEWQRGLRETEERVVCEIFLALPGFELGPVGVQDAVVIIRETSITDVMEAIAGCAAEFIQRDAKGAVTLGSWNEAFEQVLKRARFAAACRRQPNLRESAGIRAGLRRRVRSSSIRFWASTIRRLEDLLDGGLTGQEVRRRLADCWSEYQVELELDAMDREIGG